MCKLIIARSTALYCLIHLILTLIFNCNRVKKEKKKGKYQSDISFGCTVCLFFKSACDRSIITGVSRSGSRTNDRNSSRYNDTLQSMLGPSLREPVKETLALCVRLMWHCDADKLELLETDIKKTITTDMCRYIFLMSYLSASGAFSTFYVLVKCNQSQERQEC